MLASGRYWRRVVRGVLVRNRSTHPFWDVIIYLPVESIITEALSRGVLMETSVLRGTRQGILYLPRQYHKYSKWSHLIYLIGLVLGRTGTLPDVHLIIRELKHVEGEG